MIAAVRSVRELGPARLIVAVPVGSRQGVDALHGEADEVIAINIPPRFRAVGDHYLHFPQVKDDEVVACLNADLSR